MWRGPGYAWLLVMLFDLRVGRDCSMEDCWWLLLTLVLFQDLFLELAMSNFLVSRVPAS